MTMSRRLLFVLAVTFAHVSSSSLPCQQKEGEPSFRITGIVVNARDNSPVLRGTVTARLVGGGRGVSREPVVADTDERGRFTLSVPSAGNWEVLASAHNIRSQPLDDHDGYFTGVILTKQSPSHDIVFHAVPDALITGNVLDEAGEAIRGAQVTLYSVDSGARQTGNNPLQSRQHAETDDRGRFEIAGLDPGEYMVEVQARPWYASAGASQLRNQATSPLVQDPSLDVVYPITWYPGVADASSAGVLTAHPGDILEADFRMVPQPAAHLLVPLPAAQPPQTGRPGLPIVLPGIQNPNVSLLMPDGSLQQVFGQIARASNGDLDISGLAPGTYQVALSGNSPGGSSHAARVLVQSGSATVLRAALPESTVTIAVDGGTGTDPSQVILVDSSTGQSFAASERPGGSGRAQGPSSSGQRVRGDGPGRDGRGDQRSRANGGQSFAAGFRGRTHSSTDGEEVTFQVPPGRYDVTLRADSLVFVTGISAAKGVVAAGRSITVPDASVKVTIHLASGFATVSGIVSFAEKASAGAMVLLVPATLGDPASLTIVRRDQTNSDGSFHLEKVIPGQYILLAIDHGWGVHWTDPSTLRSYLVHGIPLDLGSATPINVKLAALVP